MKKTATRGADVTHNHSNGSSHAHAVGNYGRAFAIGIALNTAFVAGEAFYGFSSNSLALLSDAGHNLSDVMGLVLAWGAIRLSRSRPTKRRTYGLRRSSILAALANAATLLFVTGAITVEAIRRFSHPTPVVGSTIMWVAAVGVLINGTTAAMFASGRKSDINVRGAFAHMAADALIALGVVVTGFMIRRTGSLWLDPATSIAISVIIALGTWGLLKESVNLAMDAVPENIDPDAVETFLRSLAGVTDVHDLHIWAMSTTEPCLTAHLTVPGGTWDDSILASTKAALHERFGIEHSTVQIERGDSVHPCEQSSESAV